MKKTIFLFAFALLGTMAFASNVNPVKKETAKTAKIMVVNKIIKSNDDEGAKYTCKVEYSSGGEYGSGTGTSNISMKDACRKALQNALASQQ